jgi:hypothetical protein
VSLEHEPTTRKRIATMLRALAVHKRVEANSEADAFERWADELENSKKKKSR